MRERFMRAGRGRPRKTSSATTIKQLGMTRDPSSQLQLMAELPDAEFETLLARGEREGRIVTTAEIVRAARQRRGLQPKPADDPNYCRVIVRIREKTHQCVMDLLSTGYQSDNLSALVDDLLTQWLAGHEAKRPASSRKKTTE